MYAYLQAEAVRESEAEIQRLTSGLGGNLRAIVAKSPPLRRSEAVAGALCNGRGGKEAAKSYLTKILHIYGPHQCHP